MSSQETLQYQAPHQHNEKESQFLASLGPREKELHELATQMLGSSYFTDKTHGFTAWIRTTGSTNQGQPPPATK
jgi:hypothetical protein